MSVGSIAVQGVSTSVKPEPPGPDVVTPSCGDFSDVAPGGILTGTITGREPVILPGNQAASGAMPSPVQTLVWPTLPVFIDPTEQVSTPTALAYSTPTLEVPEAMLARDYGGWNFKAAKLTGSRVSALVTYDDRSREGLERYAEMNRTYADQLATGKGEISANITFRGFLDPDLFYTWARENNIRVIEVDTRVIDGNGMSGPIQ